MRQTDSPWGRVVALLDAHPDARLNAMDERGLVVPLPVEMAAYGRQQLLARSAIEVVDPLPTAR